MTKSARVSEKLVSSDLPGLLVAMRLASQNSSNYSQFLLIKKKHILGRIQDFLEDGSVDMQAVGGNNLCLSHKIVKMSIDVFKKCIFAHLYGLNERGRGSKRHF